MKILIISFFDDNFGDMLIRVCFQQLIKVAFKNLNFRDDGVIVEAMDLFNQEQETIKSAKIIVIPGGALFGISYLNSLEHIESVITIASENHIPVIFSSLGLNNSSLSVKKVEEIRLYRLLESKCIKAISVRDGLEIFRKYDQGQRDIQVVCDPAVWAKKVYHFNLLQNDYSGKVVGINVVRGGLFKANGLKWTTEAEEKYLRTISKALEKKGIEYKFFTNGQFLDSHELKKFARIHNIPNEKIIIPDTAREVVKTIDGFNVVLAFRMHSSIVSYGCNVPSINLVWNDKIVDFYNHIGYPERAFRPKDWKANILISEVEKLLLDDDYKVDEEYAMSLYRFIFSFLCDLCGIDSSKTRCYDFVEVCKVLAQMKVPEEEDILDYKTKISKGLNAYDRLYERDKNKKIELERLKKNIYLLGGSLERENIK